MTETKIIHLSHPGRYCAGLGDCITWAWVANGPIPLSFYAQGRNRELLELLGCRLVDSPEGAIDPHEAYNVELRERCSRPRVEIWCEYIGIPCEPKRPEWKMERRGFMGRRVILCPHTHFKTREYPPAYWLDLNWELRNRNIDVLWMMEHDDKQYVNRGPSCAYWGFSMKDVAGLISSAAVIVGNDSMPAHMGGTLGRPTIALMGPTSPNVFHHMVDVMPMQSQIATCVGCHFGPPSFRAACDMSCQALMTLLPVDVAETVAFCVEKIDHASRRVFGSLPSEEPATPGN